MIVIIAQELNSLRTGIPRVINSNVKHMSVILVSPQLSHHIPLEVHSHSILYHSSQIVIKIKYGK